MRLLLVLRRMHWRGGWHLLIQIGDRLVRHHPVVGAVAVGRPGVVLEAVVVGVAVEAGQSQPLLELLLALGEVVQLVGQLVIFLKKDLL